MGCASLDLESVIIDGLDVLALPLLVVEEGFGVDVEVDVPGGIVETEDELDNPVDPSPCLGDESAWSNTRCPSGIVHGPPTAVCHSPS